MPKGTEKLSEVRCNKCNSLLAKAKLDKGTIEIKCKCGQLNVFSEDLILPKPVNEANQYEVTVQFISRS